MRQVKITRPFDATARGVGMAGDRGDAGNSLRCPPGVKVAGEVQQRAQSQDAAEATVIQACRDICSAHPEFRGMAEGLLLSKLGGALSQQPELMGAVRERYGGFGSFVAQHKRELFSGLDVDVAHAVPPCESVREVERLARAMFLVVRVVVREHVESPRLPVWLGARRNSRTSP